jgi:hypothetical protein
MPPNVSVANLQLAITMTIGRRKAYPQIQALDVEEAATIGNVVVVLTMIGEVIRIVEEEAVVEAGISVVVDVGEEEVVVDIEVLMILIARRMEEGQVIGIMITLLVVEAQDNGILTIEYDFEYRTFA